MAAEALSALMRGDDSEDAQVGALLVSSAMDDLRTISRFCTNLGKALSKKKR